MKQNRMRVIDIIRTLSTATNLKQADVRNFLKTLSTLVENEVTSGKDFFIPGLVKFAVKPVKAKKGFKGINPFTKKKMIVKSKPASKKLAAKPVKFLKEAVKVVNVVNEVSQAATKIKKLAIKDSTTN